MAPVIISNHQVEALLEYGFCYIPITSHVAQPPHIHSGLTLEVQSLQGDRYVTVIRALQSVATEDGVIGVILELSV